MKPNPWIKRIGIAAIIVAVLSAIGAIVEHQRPGTVMCPLRRLAQTLGVELPTPHLSAEQQAAAQATGRVWKAEALEQFPGLQVQLQPVAEQENGFLQLYQLERSEKPSEALLKLLGKFEDLDAQAAQAALAANRPWVEQIEGIAALTRRSSSGMPEDYVGFFPARPTKQAFDTLWLKSLLAAKAGDEASALHHMTAAGNLIDHLQQVETPTLLTETVCLIGHFSRMELILRHLLPALGRNADLPAWRRQLERMTITPGRVAVALRGEWQTSSEHFHHPLLAMLHMQRMLIDPEAVALAHAGQIADRVETLQSISFNELKALDMAPAELGDLSREGHGILCSLDAGISSWIRGYIRAARIHACHQAAFDLLQLEPCQGDLSAEDATHITRDPLTGEPLIFDAEARTLELPGDEPDLQLEQPLALPW